MNDDTREIEISRWETPFEFGDLMIFDVAYGNGGFYMDFGKDAVKYELEGTPNKEWDSLTVRLFNICDRTVYRLEFEYIKAYRLLDDAGLCEIWGSDARKMAHEELGKYPYTFLVRGHGWSHESSLSFFMGTNDGWTYMIASETTCLEVLSMSPPTITAERKIEPQLVN